MSSIAAKSLALIAAGFVGGIAVANLPLANASLADGTIDPTKKAFIVSVNEVKQSFVFADEFSGTYEKTLTMSDGSIRKIALRPIIKDDNLLVEFKDNAGLTYMSPNGTTTNGKLMVQLRDKDQADAEFAALTD